MSADISIELEEKTDSKLDKNVRCRNCEHIITSPTLAIQPHEHTFRNPAGYSYHVLCYSDAPGAASVGDATDEATWFPGYAWTFALCKQCQNHVGWWYTGKDNFTGLIATRVTR